MTANKEEDNAVQVEAIEDDDFIDKIGEKVEGILPSRCIRCFKPNDACNSFHSDWSTDESTLNTTSYSIRTLDITGSSTSHSANKNSFNALDITGNTHESSIDDTASDTFKDLNQTIDSVPENPSNDGVEVEFGPVRLSFEESRGGINTIVHENGDKARLEFLNSTPTTAGTTLGSKSVPNLSFFTDEEHTVHNLSFLTDEEPTVHNLSLLTDEVSMVSKFTEREESIVLSHKVTVIEHGTDIKIDVSSKENTQTGQTSRQRMFV